MLKKLFGNKKEKFAMELPDTPEQESNAVFSPPVVEKTEAETAPAADGKADALTVKEGEEAPATASAPTPAPATSNYVDTRDIIAAAVKESSAATKAEEEQAASGVSFAEAFATTAGNKSDRRRPGMSMEPFMGLAKTMGSKV